MSLLVCIYIFVRYLPCTNPVLYTHAYLILSVHTILYIHIYTYSDYLPKLGLREGWKDALQSLAQKNVPTFLFSSGYGDIVQQVRYSDFLY